MRTPSQGSAVRRYVSSEVTRSPENAVVFLIALACCAGACTQQSNDGSEARALLDRLTSIDLNAPSNERAARIAALRRLVLKQPALLALRDRCALAYGGLLAAERQQDQVRQRLDRADAGALSPAELSELRATLAAATDDLAEARAALPACLEAARRLSRSSR